MSSSEQKIPGSAGSHLYQFYKTDEEYVHFMTNFFCAGLMKGDACIWLVDDAKTIKRMQSEAQKMIPDFLLYLCTGQMTMCSAQDWYLTEGCFDEEKAVANAGAYIQKMFEKGYSAIRGSGDVASIPRKERYKLESYEAKMHPMIKQIPLIAVCAYPIEECGLGDIRMILEHHDHRAFSHAA